MAKEKECLFGPVLLREDVQISAHPCGKFFSRELQPIFPSVQISALESLIAIVTMQHTKYDLVNFGSHIEVEKDDRLESFIRLATVICDSLSADGYWSDYIDPCSGLPMRSDSNKVYSEVAGAEALLGYSFQNAGCCKVLLHPQWGSAVYPATMFTTAPAERVTQLLTQLQANHRNSGDGPPHGNDSIER